MREAIAFIVLMTGIGLLVEVATSPTPSTTRCAIGFILIGAATVIGLWRTD